MAQTFRHGYRLETTGLGIDNSCLSMARAKLADPGLFGLSSWLIGLVGCPEAPSPPLPTANARANQLDALAGVLSLERRDQLAACQPWSPQRSRRSRCCARRVRMRPPP